MCSLGKASSKVQQPHENYRQDVFLQRIKTCEEQEENKEAPAHAALSPGIVEDLLLTSMSEFHTLQADLLLKTYCVN